MQGGKEQVVLKQGRKKKWECCGRHGVKDPFAKAHESTRRLAGGRFGPKRRNFSLLAGALPTSAEWLEVWKRKEGKVECWPKRWIGRPIRERQWRVGPHHLGWRK